MDLPSTKPYLIRAIHEWCCDNGFTPHIAVIVDERTRVPREFVRDGQIVLNVGYDAANKLQIANDQITFQARFGGIARDLLVPIGCVAAIYARENGAGMAFDPDGEARSGEAEEVVSTRPQLVEVTDDSDAPHEPPPTPPAGRPKLQRVK